MNKESIEIEDDDMLSEYDFSQAVRGKHVRELQHGYKIRIHKMDGTIEERDYTIPEGSVILDPDVRVYFPTSEAVNKALRGLIDLIPQPLVNNS